MKDNKKKAFLRILTEFLFTILPILIIFVFRGPGEGWAQIFSTGELMFISVVLWGQPIVKFFYASPQKTNNCVKGFHVEKLTCVIAAVIVCGLVPSCIILTKILDNNGNCCNEFLESMKNNTEPPQWVQGILFVLSVLCFFVLGIIAELKIKLIQEEDNKEKL